MSQKYKNRYRVDSARLKGWDYATEGAYFITICTHDMRHFFGSVRNGKMQLSPLGVIADLLWFEIKNHAKNVRLGAFVIMPNHMHGVLILVPSEPVAKDNSNGLPPRLSEDKKAFFKAISPKSNAIATIIRSYKSAVSRHAHRLGYEFSWQPRYYDIIIRNADSFEKIQNYILNNPKNWKCDKFHAP